MTPQTATQQIAAAATLEQLLAALHADTAEARQAEVEDISRPDTDWSSLPTYGGEKPSSTSGVWSWDATRLLVGTCAADLQLIARSEHPPEVAARADEIIAIIELAHGHYGITERQLVDVRDYDGHKDCRLYVAARWEQTDADLAAGYAATWVEALAEAAAEQEA